MSKNPLVSIVIPVYNGSNYLREAIDSALAQSYSNVEIVVINDGSNDNGATREISLGYGNKIRYFEKENGGVSSALNLGIKEMKGEYFSWLSHDDVYCRNKISQQIEFVKRNEIYACFSNYSIIDDKGIIIDQSLGDCYEMPNALIELFGHGYINGCSFLINKNIFLTVGLFDENLKYTQDVDMWIKILSRFKVLKIDKDLVFQRKHSNQGSALFKKEVNLELRSVYLDNLNSNEVSNILFRTINKRFVTFKSAKLIWIGDRLLFKRNDIIGAFNMYKEAIKVDTFTFLYVIKNINNLLLIMIKKTITNTVNRIIHAYT